MSIQGKKLIKASLLLVVLACCVFLTSVIARNSKINELEETAAERLKLYQSTINQALNKYRYRPYLLSQNKKIVGIVTEKRDGALVNQFLADVSEESGAAAIFIMDKTGETVAASNWDTSTSFIGHNYGFRPYFKAAMAGKRGDFYAIGVTTGKPGYFMSHPIRYQGKIRGVTVVKVDLSSLQKYWLNGGETVFVTDGNGVIFLSSREVWKYRAAVPLTPEILGKIRSGQQYRAAELATLPMDRGVVAGSEWITISGEKFLWSSIFLPTVEWRLHYLLPWQLIKERMHGVGIISAITAVLLVLGLLFLRERRLKMISQRKVLEAERIRKINKKLQMEIEERRRAEIDLRQTQDELVQAGKLAALGQMSAAIVHELNQPISAICTTVASSRILLQRRQTRELNETLQSISELTSRMAAITKQLKSFSRKSPLKMEKIDLRQPVQKAIDLLKYTISDTNCTLDVQIPDEQQWVLGDALRLEQVFVNLIRNGLDAMQDHDEKILVLTFRNAAHAVEVSVVDSGTGISSEIMSQVFEPFFTTKASGDGLGLGLSISYGIMKDMNGDIRAENSTAGGAAFTVSMQRYKDNED